MCPLSPYPSYTRETYSKKEKASQEPGACVSPRLEPVKRLVRAGTPALTESPVKVLCKEQVNRDLEGTRAVLAPLAVAFDHLELFLAERDTGRTDGRTEGGWGSGLPWLSRGRRECPTGLAALEF